MADQSGSDDWRWLNQALFGADDGFAAATGRGLAADSAGSDAHRWAVLPSAEAPRRLVPADRTCAAASFANVHDAMGARRLLLGRLTRRVVQWGLPLGLRGTASLPMNLGIGGDAHRSVLAEIGERLDVSGGAQVAITLGPRRYNRKPVVQVIDPGGTTVAFVKVACDEITGAFVDNEAHWLQRAEESRGAVLAPPAVLADWEWRDRRLLAVAPVHPSTHDPERLDRDRLAALTREVAELGPRRAAPVRDASILARATDAAAAASDDRLAAAIQRIVSTWGDVELDLGPWHGDMTPWNTITSGATTALLDWEFAADDMPVGADLIHNGVMVATHLEDVAIGDALATTLRSLPGVLGGFPNATVTEASFALYLIELARRDAQLAAIGETSTGFGSAALSMLERLLDA